MKKNIVKGKVGEKLAAEYLIKKGYKIITTNWRYSRIGELDIIALEKNTLVFVEVKSRTSTAFGHPIEAVDFRKMEKLRTLAGLYINENADLSYKGYRFDVIGVILQNTPKIEHLRNVYQF